MNQILTFVAALALIFTTSAAVAGNNQLNSNQSVAILTKQVDRALISELKLNEMEYIRLKDLNKAYQQEAAATKTLYAGNAELAEVKMQELNNRYQAELTKVLSSSQINSLTQYQTIALNK